MTEYNPKAVDLSNLEGRQLTNDGYIRVKTPEGHPYTGRKILLHRLIKENELGRVLRPDEKIHHRDGNKLNNAPENLRVCTNREHSLEHARYPKLWTDWLRDEYFTKGRSVSEISATLGCRPHTVRYALRERCIPVRYELSPSAIEARRKGGKAKKPREVDYTACDPEWLIKEFKKGRSLRSLGTEIGWHKNKVKMRLRSLGVS